MSNETWRDHNHWPSDGVISLLDALRDRLNALEAENARLAAKAALLDEIIDHIKRDGYDLAWPYGAEMDWMPRYDALTPADAQEPRA